MRSRSVRTRRHPRAPRAALLVVLGACAEPSSATAPTAPATSPASPVPNPSSAPDARFVTGAAHSITSPSGAPLQLSLRTAGRRFFLGQNVLVDQVLDNTGTEAVTISWGGDYRGATRHTRFRVQVFAEDGTLVRDPDPSGFNLGGLGGETTIEPGERWIESLGLVRYAHIERPGRYRVRVFHDLGWSRSAEPGREPPVPDDDPRWAELTLEFIMPTPEQAKAVVEAMRALPPDAAGSVGQPSAPYPDYGALRHPPYLPILRALIEEQGISELMAGLAAMPHPEATAAILDLATHPKPIIATAALEALVGRLPRPTGPNHRPPFTPADFSREFLASRAWQPRFDAAARRMGLQLIVHTDPERSAIGSAILESLGGSADLPALIAALDTALDQSQANGATKRYPHPPTPHGALIRVLEKLIAEGAPVDPTPSSPGMIVAYLLRWGSAERRPADYAQQAARWMRHPIPTVRELTVVRTKGPLPALMADQLGGMLDSDELSLQVVACDAITALAQPRFAGPVLALAQTARDEWLIRAIEAAALASGVRRSKIVRVWARRLDEPGVGWEMFEQLINLLAQSGGNGFGQQPSAEEAKRLERAWTAFIAEHEDAIDQGTVFSLDGPEFTSALVPKGTELSPR